MINFFYLTQHLSASRMMVNLTDEGYSDTTPYSNIVTLITQA